MSHLVWKAGPANRRPLRRFLAGKVVCIATLVLAAWGFVFLLAFGLGWLADKVVGL
jgi:hypothetical protein